MIRSVAVIDYGAGNILNVLRAFRSQGISAELVTQPQRLHLHSHIVLPGVGAFDYGMQRLDSTGLSKAITQLVGDARPLLGICLGMQLLAEVGLENGRRRGLGIIQGTVARLNLETSPRERIRIPHTGWAEVSVSPAWSGAFELSAFPIRTAYFNHSYFVSESAANDVAATVAIGSLRLPAVIANLSTLAVQFHPEKSGEAGLRMLRDWVNGSL